MGWRKMLSHFKGGDIVLGNWRAAYNKKEDSIDILHPSDGIPYIKSDTTFSGTLFYLEVVGGKLQIEQYMGWPDTVAQDEGYVLDDTTAWDEATATFDEFIDYLFGSTAIALYYDGVAGGPATFVTDEIDLSAVGKYHSSKLEWIATEPAGTDIVVYSSVSVNGGDWGAWTAIAASGNSIGCLPAADSDISLYKIRHKIVLTPTVDLLTTPDMSSLTTTINSQKHFRVMSDGSYKESQHIVDSILGTTTEILT